MPASSSPRAPARVAVLPRASSPLPAACRPPKRSTCGLVSRVPVSCSTLRLGDPVAPGNACPLRDPRGPGGPPRPLLPLSPPSPFKSQCSCVAVTLEKAHFLLLLQGWARAQAANMLLARATRPVTAAPPAGRGALVPSLWLCTRPFGRGSLCPATPWGAQLPRNVRDSAGGVGQVSSPLLSCLRQ